MLTYNVTEELIGYLKPLYSIEENINQKINVVIGENFKHHNFQFMYFPGRDKVRGVFTCDGKSIHTRVIDFATFINYDNIRLNKIAYQCIEFYRDPVSKKISVSK